MLARVAPLHPKARRRTPIDVFVRRPDGFHSAKSRSAETRQLAASLAASGTGT